MTNIDMQRTRPHKPVPSDPEEVANELVVLARRYGYPYIDDLAEYPIDTGAWELIPHSLFRRHTIVPIGFEGDHLIVAVSNPADVIALDDIRMSTDRDVDIVVAAAQEINELLRRMDHLDTTAETLLEEAAKSEEDEKDEEEFSADEAPIVKAINRIITRAVQQRASDIHIEPEQKDVRIRYRIDGVLTEAMHTRRSLHAGMTSRLKVMADLDISERRAPQDGRVTVHVDGRSVDLRVATLPTAWGEKIVLRILDHEDGVHQLSDLGFGPEALEIYRGAVARPHGAVLITGPTGSGKSTTLYATLETINTPGLNIVTIEDPVEARIAGLNQMQVHPKAGVTFATALRSILRSDPDVVMVGEMRDQETAAIGIQAALTGHLVFSTLHTNDAVSAVTRLTDMGVEPFLVASALECVVAQRLARKLCPKCKEAYVADEEFVVAAGIPWTAGEPLPTLYHPAGCVACSGTGYRGRIALVEVLRMSDELRALTVGRYPAEDIKKQASYEGLRTLREDGLWKALAGETSVEEVLRVVV